jgi:bacterioferritin (cytochrome b1)
MNRKEIIDLLNIDLINEYTHMAYYLQSASLVEGLHRNSLKAFLQQEAQGELQHVMIFSDKICSLGGMPAPGLKTIPQHHDPKDILTHAIMMEKEVVKNYAKRIYQADHFAEASSDPYEGIALRLMLEKQLEDSHDDLQEMTRMLKGL